MAKGETMEDRMTTFIVRGNEAALQRLFDASRGYQNRHNGRCLISASSQLLQGREYEVQTEQSDLLTTVAMAAGVDECFERVPREREHEVRERCFEGLPVKQQEIEQTVKNLLEKKLPTATVHSDIFVGLSEAWRRLCAYERAENR